MSAKLGILFGITKRKGENITANVLGESLSSYLAKKRAASKNLQLLVPRPGIEPGWIAPLVFETSASTDSAIWAIAGAKVQIKIEIANFLVIFFLKKQFQRRKKLKMCFISPILY